MNSLVSLKATHMRWQFYTLLNHTQSSWQFYRLLNHTQSSWQFYRLLNHTQSSWQFYRLLYHTVKLIFLQTAQSHTVKLTILQTAVSHTVKLTHTKQMQPFFIVVPCILITLKFLSPTNAPLYYTYKMLKYTVKISHDCSYTFRSTWTETCRSNQEMI